MSALRRWNTPLLAAFLLLVAIGGNGQADVVKSGALQRKDLDATVSRTLRDVINRGADLYNSGDTAGCYRLYEGALLALRPLLDHRPELQKSITQALDDARKTPAQFQRAFVLREVIDKIRGTVRGTPPAATKPSPPAVKKPATSPPPSAQTLWQSLGADMGVAKVVDDFVAGAAADSKVNFSRNGKYKLDEAKLADLKKKLVDMISSVTGGPRKYQGETAMKKAHEGMGITDAEFDAAAGHLQKALETNGAQPEDIKAVLAHIESTRNGIVETKATAAPPPVPPSAGTVWERLGGADNVKKIVDDFASAAASDPKVNFSRGGKFKLEPDEVTDLKKKLVDMISEATGGPFKYKGKKMKDSHQGMGITEAEFDAYAAHLKSALEKNRVKPDDVKTVLAVIENTRKDIVEKKPAEKKPEEKKAPEQKKGGGN